MNYSGTMKKLTILFFLSVVFVGNSLFSQDEPPRLTHHMTPEEELRKHEIGRGFTPTDPPAPPVRAVAEFEEMQSVLIRYPFGIPMTLIQQMSLDCKVKTIVASSSQQNTVLNQYQAAGVNIANCEWLIAPTDSYWTRDYGPWFVVDGDYEVGISDFPYNRPRPNDDNIPVVLSQQMGVPLYGMNLIHTGGNWMCDGMGVAASTQLVWTENPSMTHAQIDTMVRHYLGIKKYHVLPDPLGEYIEHIDCWGKFLDVDKILIGQVPSTDWRYAAFEYVATYFSLQTSSYGTPYQIYRVYTPGNYPYTPYTNSLILNKKVFVPITGSQWDNQALQVYQSAMPGYQIIGISHSNWANTDALHCRAIGIADVGMLHVHHMPLLGNKDFRLSFDLAADIVPYSGDGIIADSLHCYFKVDDGGYQSVPLISQGGYQYMATLPFIPPGSAVSYYLHAADSSGRKKNHPYIGAPDPHVFGIKYATDAVIAPDTLLFLSVEDMLDGKSFDIYNFTNGELVIDYIETESWGDINWYIDPWNYNLPVTMAFSDTITLTVKINIPVNYQTGGFVTDALDIITEYGHHQVVIRVDEDLLTGLPGYPLLQSKSRLGKIHPNPFNDETRITFTLEEPSWVKLCVYDIQGRLMSTLAEKNYVAGNHEITWHGNTDSGMQIPAGVYFIRMQSNFGLETKKAVINR